METIFDQLIIAGVVLVAVWSGYFMGHRSSTDEPIIKRSPDQGSTDEPGDMWQDVMADRVETISSNGREK